LREGLSGLDIKIKILLWRRKNILQLKRGTPGFGNLFNQGLSARTLSVKDPAPVARFQSKDPMKMKGFAG